jgi:hypothetical protein
VTHPIPDEALNSHIGILGKTGVGKSYTAKGLVERLLHLNRHVVIIDPTGAWYGLRTGFEIPIFGGRHGDVEIGDKAGEAVAGVIVDQRTSAIIDLSLMTGGGQQRFMRTFAHRLRQKPLGALYLVIDEADEFLPQNVPSDQTNAYGDLRWMVRRGRLSGFRVMMITQRPAEIAKAVLTQIETLIAHRLTAPQDRKAIEEWVKGHHAPDEAREVLNSLASLEKGTAWVWAPDLGILKREAMPPIETFDSSRTPEPGEREVAPPRLEALDLSAIREALAVAEERVAVKGGKAPTWPDQREEVARLKAHVVAHEATIAGLNDAIAAERRRISRIAAICEEESPIPAPHGEAPAPPPRRAPATPPKAAPRPVGGVASPSGSPAALAIAELLDRINPARVTWTQAATMTGRKASGGNFNSARKWLRESGRIVEDGDFIRSSAEAPAGMSRDEAITLWKSVLSNPAPRMIDALETSPLGPDGLAERLGVQPRGGNWNNGLAQLRRNGVAEIIEGRWQLCRPLPGESD